MKSPMPGTIRPWDLFVRAEKKAAEWWKSTKPVISILDGLFCCVSALPTFMRGARESWGGGGGAASRSRLSVVDLLSSH